MGGTLRSARVFAVPIQTKVPSPNSWGELFFYKEFSALPKTQLSRPIMSGHLILECLDDRAYKPSLCVCACVVVVVVGVMLIVMILVWTVLLDIQVLVSDIPVSSPQYCDNDLILHVAMAYTVNLRQYYGHTGAEWLARNKGKHAAVHSARVGVPLCTGRQPSRNGRVQETRENMRLSIPNTKYT